MRTNSQEGQDKLREALLSTLASKSDVAAAGQNGKEGQDNLRTQLGNMVDILSGIKEDTVSFAPEKVPATGSEPGPPQLGNMMDTISSLKDIVVAMDH